MANNLISSDLNFLEMRKTLRKEIRSTKDVDQDILDVLKDSQAILRNIEDKLDLDKILSSMKGSEGRNKKEKEEKEDEDEEEKSGTLKDVFTGFKTRLGEYKTFFTGRQPTDTVPATNAPESDSTALINTSPKTEVQQKLFAGILKELSDIRKAMLGTGINVNIVGSEIENTKGEAGDVPSIDIDIDKKPSRASRVGGALKRAGSGIARFLGSPGGKALGAAAAIGMGAYTAYSGFNEQEDIANSERDKAKKELESGLITKQEYDEKLKVIDATETENKGGAIGKGTGLAAGAIGGGIAGAKLGAGIGTFFGGPVGTAVGAGIGTLAGGAIGAFSGSEVGQNIGGAIGKGVTYLGEAADKGKKFIGSIGDRIKDAYNKGIVEEKGITQTDQLISTSSDLAQTSEQSGGGTLDKTNIQTGITSKKTFLGSTMLGSLLTKEGKVTGEFLGQSSKESVLQAQQDVGEHGNVSNLVENNQSSLLGTRTSGGLFGRDKYAVQNGKGESTELTKNEYNRIQKLIESNKIDDAHKELQNIKDKRIMNEEIGKIYGRTPEDMVTPMTQLSRDNEALKRQASSSVNLPPVVSNTVQTNNTQTLAPIKAQPRNATSSALEKYIDRPAVFA